MCAYHVMIKRVTGKGFVLGVHDTILTTTSSNRSASSHSTSSTLEPNSACSATVALYNVTKLSTHLNSFNAVTERLHACHSSAHDTPLACFG